MGALARHAVIVAIGGLLGCATTQVGLHRDAAATLAREDARGLGSATLARHPNPYVRIEALQRMEKRSAQLDDAEVTAAAAALGDDTPVFSDHCRQAVDRGRPLYPAQGIEHILGLCGQSADSPAAHAVIILRTAPADRVTRAVVARAVALRRPGLDQHARDILQLRGPEASTALLDAIAAALPTTDPKTTAALLQAAGFAAPGSGTPATLALVERAMNAPDPRVQARAAAALLRLTDRPGPEPASWTAPPRATAVSALAAQIAAEVRAGNGSQALPALTDIGPSAAPLLDAILTVLTRYTGAVGAIKAIGPRARRASEALIAFDNTVFAQRSYEDVDPYHADVLDALVAIEAPAADIEARARKHLGRPMPLMLSALTALAAVEAKLSEEELDQLQATVDGECTNGRLVRMSLESATECQDVEDKIAQLRKSNGTTRAR